MTAAPDDKVERVRDLTARHIGRQVQIGGWFEGVLRELSASDQPDEVDLTVLGDGKISYGNIPLDTPCELLAMSPELRGGRFQAGGKAWALAQHWCSIGPFDVTIPPRDTTPVYVEDAVALLDVITPDDAEVLREYLNGGRP